MSKRHPRRNPLPWIISACLIAIGVGLMMVVASSATPLPSWLVKLEMQSPRGNGSCSGSHIGRGLVLTAAHCFPDVRSINVITDRGNVAPASIMWTNTAYDVALIRADFEAASAEITCRALQRGDHVVAYGYPFGIDRVETLGRVASNDHLDVPRMWRDVLVVDMTVGPGSSGGPLMYRGQINGVVVGGFTGIGFSLVVPSRVVCDMLAR
jgi:S1-C subfamily serine protease